MAQGTLHDSFIMELRDTYDAEKQLAKALPKLAKAATSTDLRAAFEQHLRETKAQIERLAQVFESIGEKPRGKHCDGMAGIIEEGKSALEEDADEATMDALLIASAQRAEHYEMAAYGTLVSWANAMGHSEAAQLLQETLDEEKATDEKLTTLAEGGINRQAAGLAHGGDQDDEDEQQAAPAAFGRRQPARAAGAATRGAMAMGARKTASAGAASASRSNGAAKRSSSSKTTGARKR